LAVPAVVVGLTMMPSEAATTPVASGVYQLASGASGKCIDVTGASADNSALLIQTACSSTVTSQQWKAAGSGQFTLANVNSTRCIDVPSASTVSGTQLQQYGCGDGTKVNQLWTFTASTAAAGKYLVKSVVSGLCISDKDGSTAGNNPIVEETCSDIAGMQWSFNYVSGPTNAPTATVAPTTSPTSTTKPTVAADGTGTYKTVQAAIDAVPASNTTRRVITIKAGTYREIVTIPSDKPYITLQGLGSAASSTVIVNNRSSAAGYGTAGSATITISGKEFNATNLTLSNDYGEGSQAVAVNVNADKSVFNNVRFLGAQDTLLLNAYRSYYVKSYVEGTVDFIFGGGVGVFNATSVYQKRSTGGPITAAKTDAAVTYGFLFYKCTITGAANNVTQLGRPWGAAAQVLYRESSLSATIKTAQPWTDMSSNTWQNARFKEYKNTGSGATANSNRPQLADSSAATYTPQKYLVGSDGWNPVG
jgi:pectinesterase